jgi:ActD protein
VPREFLVGRFAHAAEALLAVRRMRARGFRIYDVHAPYPIHGMDEAMGLRRSRLPMVALVAGAGGLVFALALQFYCAVFDWPLNVGGKPANSTLAFVPIAFELTVLCAGLATAGAFLFTSRLLPGATAHLLVEGATDDVFTVVLRKRDATFDAGEARRLLLDSGAYSVKTVVVSP